LPLRLIRKAMFPAAEYGHEVAALKRHGCMGACHSQPSVTADDQVELCSLPLGKTHPPRGPEVTSKANTTPKVNVGQYVRKHIHGTQIVLLDNSSRLMSIDSPKTEN
jgi:hypothetical protein